ncbi:MAG: ROK family protein, partial [Odoribacter sp.]|nr:ROK family protein [Odoribacter sp.]
SIIDELIEEGWVLDQGQGASIGGKRPHIFSLNPDAAYIMGVDMGREHLKIAIFNLRKEIIGNIQTFPSLLETHQDNETIIRDLKIKIEKSLIDLKIPRAKIKVAGFSLPGLLDNEGNSFTYLAFEGTNIRKILEDMLHIPIFIDNDSTIMAMAEHNFGAAQGASHALCVNINECIGLGMILNSRPYNGYKGMAGEFGHTRITGPEILCYCGKAGCLETIASGRAIVKAAQIGIKEGKASILRNPNLTFTDIIQAAKQDDIFAIELLQKAGEKIGEALANLIHLFNPELIVIGGQITGANEIISSSVRQAIDKYTITRLKNQCEIKTSTLPDHSCVLGTLSLVMEHLYYDTESNFSLY